MWTPSLLLLPPYRYKPATLVTYGLLDRFIMFLRGGE